MKIFHIGFILIALASAAAAQTFYGTTDVDTFRKGRDAEFRNPAETPLKAEDRAKYKTLNYYPVSPSFRLSATFTRTADEKYFHMPTSSGATKQFVKYGVLNFTLGQKPMQLNVYQIDAAVLAKFPEYADLLFVPFKDNTSRTETYGGGRYIDIKAPKPGQKVILDFNLAYNPNCAYGDNKYSCPIPPRENTLDFAVTAGEKRYAYTGYDPVH